MPYALYCLIAGWIFIGAAVVAVYAIVNTINNSGKDGIS